jgi:outer membrane beta-barrel protein
MGLVADLDLEFSPIYGKLSLLAQWFPGFNMYGMVGPSFVMYGPNNAFTVGGNVGIGFRFFITRWLALRTELRDIIYSEAQQGLGAMSGNSVRNQLFFDLGLSFFLPTDFTEN